MTSLVSALTARTQLGQIMRRATKNNERFVVGRRGEPQVVILSLRDYLKVMVPPPKWLQNIRTAAKRQGLNALSMNQINAEVAATRRDQRKTSRK